ncbi:hypothetical protein BFC17_15965 [Alteromonas lipolytica]|uniref:DUF2878 domain-containing protein n=2 Tax=Alteromonas lipolytica TaxID=1856405 RepID=A0A1E8FHF4_9ALTE|nr:hypothetical protein BFC17_15965 [Alteromonas lipolytica]
MVINLLNLLGFQVCWWLLILYQDQYWWVVAAMLCCHLLLVRGWASELLIMLCVAVTGLLTDSLLTLSGVYIFSDAGQLLPVPFWLGLLWAAFAATLRHSLGYLRKHYGLAAGLGAIGGTSSYVAGMQLGAVSFGPELSVVVGLLVVVWALLTPLIYLLTEYVEATSIHIIQGKPERDSKEIQ